MSFRVVVVGGGVSGLAAAHRLIETAGPAHVAPQVTVLEAAPRLGGQVWTERRDGFLFETGADTLLAQKPAGVALCRRLGLESALDDLSARHAGTQILHRGRLLRVPEGFLMMAPTRLGPFLGSPLFSWRGKARTLAEPLVRRRAAGVDDESLSSFVLRRFGREALERVAEPVVAGLYTADADRLSLRMTMPRFLDLEATHGSVTRGLRDAMKARAPRPFGHGTGGGGFYALKGGLGTMIDALAARLPAGSTRTGARAVALTPNAGGWTIALAGGETIAADAVVLACPAFEAATLLNDADPALSGALAGMSYASCATAHLVYHEREVGGGRGPSFGFFVPRTEKVPILACSYVSEKFEGRGPSGAVVLRVFLGGATDPGLLDLDDDGIVKRAHDAIAQVLHLATPPWMARVHRHPRSMPQYDVGSRALLAGIVAAAECHQGLFVAGSVAGAVGIPDCVRVAEEAAGRVAAFLRSRASQPGWVAYQANQNA